jgi:hypothetical protein
MCARVYVCAPVQTADLHTLVQTYKEWGFAMFPSLPFDPLVEKMQKLSGNKIVGGFLMRMHDHQDRDSTRPMTVVANDALPGEGSGEGDEGMGMHDDTVDWHCGCGCGCGWLSLGSQTFVRMTGDAHLTFW